MAKFHYKAKRGLEEVVEGFVEAENQEEALNKITAQGLFPIRVVIETSAVSKKEPQNLIQKNIVNRRITQRDILNFTQKLTTLVKARVELLGSLRILYEQTENIRFKTIILEIYESSKEGKTFSESLSRFPSVFSNIFVNIVKAGEASGRLDSALEQINEFSTREENLRSKILVAMAYPALLTLVGLSSIFVLINFVVPRLKPIFANLGSDLPLITKIIIKMSELSSKTWLSALAVVIAVILFLYKTKGTSFYKSYLRKIKTSVPIVKRLVKNQELAHFSRALALLLNSGVPALRSLEIATSSIEDKKLKMELDNACRDIAAGQGLSKSMENQTSLSSFFIKMIAVGEESGRLKEVLDEISNSYTQQIELDIALITSLLEPILILVLGMILGSIVLSILLPTFQITQIVH